MLKLSLLLFLIRYQVLSNNSFKPKNSDRILEFQNNKGDEPLISFCNKIQFFECGKNFK